MICVNIILEIVLYPIWNSFPDYVIDANSIGLFENSLDRFCSNLACLFDYKADLTGTGSRSQM